MKASNPCKTQAMLFHKGNILYAYKNLHPIVINPDRGNES